MEILKSIRWRWIVIGALIAQLALIPVTLGGGWLAYRLAWPNWASFGFYNAAMFLVLLGAAYSVAPKAGPNGAVNGALIGVLAALIILPFLIALPPEYPLHEAINEALKVIGGAIGGSLASRRSVR